MDTKTKIIELINKIEDENLLRFILAFTEQVINKISATRTK